MVPTATLSSNFKDLTTMKNMYLARYKPWEKTKRDQLQSWNNLSFDLQKTNIDEQINLVLTLGNMLKQDEQIYRYNTENHTDSSHYSTFLGRSYQEGQELRTHYSKM